MREEKGKPDNRRKPDLVEFGRSFDNRMLSQQLWQGSLLWLARRHLQTTFAGNMVIYGTREGTFELALVPWIRGVHSRVLGGGTRGVQVPWGRSSRLHGWHQYDSWSDDTLPPTRARRAGFPKMVSNRLVDCRRYRSRRGHRYFITGLLHFNRIPGNRGSNLHRGSWGSHLHISHCLLDMNGDIGDSILNRPAK